MQEQRFPAIRFRYAISGGKKDKKGAPPTKPQKPPSPKKEEIAEKKDSAGKIQEKTERKTPGHETEMDAEEYVPVVKEAVIGQYSLIFCGVIMYCPGCLFEIYPKSCNSGLKMLIQHATTNT